MKGLVDEHYGEGVFQKSFKDELSSLFGRVSTDNPGKDDLAKMMKDSPNEAVVQATWETKLALSFKDILIGGTKGDIRVQANSEAIPLKLMAET